jgi:hypothetical protein
MEQKLYASKGDRRRGKPLGHANAASMARQEAREHPDFAQQFGSTKGLREVLNTAHEIYVLPCSLVCRVENTD